MTLIFCHNMKDSCYVIIYQTCSVYIEKSNLNVVGFSRLQEPTGTAMETKTAK